MTFELKLPHSPRSAVMTMSSGRDPGGAVTRSNGCASWSTRDDQAVQHFQHALRERPRRDDAFLRAPQARRGDHLHRLGDLLRRLDGADPAAEVYE